MYSKSLPQQKGRSEEPAPLTESWMLKNQSSQAHLRAELIKQPSRAGFPASQPMCWVIGIVLSLAYHKRLKWLPEMGGEGLSILANYLKPIMH